VPTRRLLVLHGWRRACLAALACAGLAAAASAETGETGEAGASAEPTLVVHYQERPPYTSTAPDGAVVGVLAPPVGQALRRAGIRFVWRRTPARRQLALIQHGQGLHCGVGWFRSPERQALGKFSREIYRDQPIGALARAELAASPATAAGLLAHASRRLIVKDGFSYGAQLDRLIRAAPAPPIVTSAGLLQIVRMIAAGRGAWTLVAPEEAQWLLASPDAGAAGLRLITLGDVVLGEPRYLYCNAAVPDAWIARIDRELGR
jgi:polar amino acid transport system substrate-binding protein